MSDTALVPSITARVGDGLRLPAEALASFGETDDYVEFEILSTRQGLLVRPKHLPPIEIYTDERIEEFTSDDAEVDRILSEAGLTA